MSYSPFNNKFSCHCKAPCYMPCIMGYLVPMEKLKNCLCCPCFLSCGTIPQVPIPPTPPLPPNPPGMTLIGEGEFGAIASATSGNDFFVPYSTLRIEGMGITHFNNSDGIILAPNTTYTFTWSLTVEPEDPLLPTDLSAALGIDGVGLVEPGSSVTGAQNVAVLFNNGTFATGPQTEPILSLRFNSSSLVIITDGFLLLKAFR